MCEQTQNTLFLGLSDAKHHTQILYQTFNFTHPYLQMKQYFQPSLFWFFLTIPYEYFWNINASYFLYTIPVHNKTVITISATIIQRHLSIAVPSEPIKDLIAALPFNGIIFHSFSETLALYTPSTSYINLQIGILRLKSHRIFANATHLDTQFVLSISNKRTIKGSYNANSFAY